MRVDGLVSRQALSYTVSVIIPVYNVEDYLDDCIQSVLNQTHANLDVVLIDDGATDASGLMCDRWAAFDLRIRVVHQTNGGLSSARNAGLDVVRGSFITFVDSDDVIAPDMIELLLKEAITHRADIVVSEFVDYTDESPLFDRTGEVLVGNGKQMLPRVVRGRINWAACDKLYRASFLADGLRFTHGALYEDVEFTPKVFVRAGTVVVTPWRLYGYRQRSQSIMGQSSQRVSPDLLRMLRSAVETVRRHYARTDDEYAALIAAYVLHASKKLEWMPAGDPANDEFRDAYRGFIRENLKEVIQFGELSRAYRLGLAFSSLSPRMFSRAAGAGRYLKKRGLGKTLRRAGDTTSRRDRWSESGGAGHGT